MPDLATLATPAPLEGDVLAALKPRLVWEIFAGMSQVPRESNKEEHIRHHLRAVAASKGFKVRGDDAGNLVVEVPATKGREKAPTLVLQAHFDMVCVKRSNSAHDFDNDPIRLLLDRRDGHLIVRADDTTLGADNGLGVALALAAAIDPAVEHGPLEILLTTNEEAGMSGAIGLKGETVKGRLLLNLDTEEDNAFYIGCAGAATTFMAWELPTSPADAGAETFVVAARGLYGGHSGAEIHKRRGNGVQILAQAMLDAPGAESLRLASIAAGTKRNAIPDRGRAVVVGPAGSRAKVEAWAAEETKRLRAKLGDRDPKAEIAVEPAPAATAAASAEATRRFFGALAKLPEGPLAMRSEKDELVETSNNPAVINSAAKDGGKALRIDVEVSTRSLVQAKLLDLQRQVEEIGVAAGATIGKALSYPPWEPNDASKLLAECKRVHRDVYGREARVATIHAGLECGLFAERLDGVEMVSMGPRIEDAHTPDERCYPASVESFWSFFTKLLAALS